MRPVRHDRRSAPGTVRVGRLALVVAPAGLGLGHLLAYALSGADAEAHLAATGHGYLPLALRVAVGVGLLGGMSAVLGGARRAQGRSTGVPAVVPTAARLAGVQATGFAVLEVVERLVAGAPLADLGPLLAVGFVVQLFVAALLAPLLVGLDRVGERLASATTSVAPRPVHRLPTCSTERIVSFGARPWSERAPPEPLLA